jgi:hypothetical protein
MRPSCSSFSVPVTSSRLKQPEPQCPILSPFSKPRLIRRKRSPERLLLTGLIRDFIESNENNLYECRVSCEWFSGLLSISSQYVNIMRFLSETCCFFVCMSVKSCVRSTSRQPNMSTIQIIFLRYDFIRLPY